MRLSVVIITHNEEANIGRTLKSVLPLVSEGKGEVVVVDSGSSDSTVEIAKSFGAKIFVEEWKGYAAQKNSAIEKATGDWILSLDADEELDSEASQNMSRLLFNQTQVTEAGVQVKEIHFHARVIEGFTIRRKNMFLGRWIRHGGFWPDPKLRLFRKSVGRFEERAVHEDVKLPKERTSVLCGALIHQSYPTLSDYIEHMNRYSSLGAEMATEKAHPVAESATRVGHPGITFSVTNIVLRPLATFIYNYFFRLGFLDGREGLLLHLYHSVYVSWKYAKAWEISKSLSD